MKALVLLLVATVMNGPVTSATPAAFDAYSLTEIRTLKALPDEVRTMFGLRDEHGGGIADRNESFNSSDVIYDATPMRRFIVGGLSADAALVCYEQGGRGYFMEAKAFNRSASGWTEIGRWHLRERPDSLHRLIELIAAAPKRTPSEQGQG